MLTDVGLGAGLVLLSDSNDCMGAVRRSGVGKHIQTRFLRAQERLEQGDFTLAHS